MRVNSYPNDDPDDDDRFEIAYLNSVSNPDGYSEMDDAEEDNYLDQYPDIEIVRNKNTGEVFINPASRSIIHTDPNTIDYWELVTLPPKKDVTHIIRKHYDDIQIGRAKIFIGDIIPQGPIPMTKLIKALYILMADNSYNKFRNKYATLPIQISSISKYGPTGSVTRYVTYQDLIENDKMFLVRRVGNKKMVTRLYESRRVYPEDAVRQLKTQFSSLLAMSRDDLIILALKAFGEGDCEEGLRRFSIPLFAEANDNIKKALNVNNHQIVLALLSSAQKFLDPVSNKKKYYKPMDYQAQRAFTNMYCLYLAINEYRLTILKGTLSRKEERVMDLLKDNTPPGLYEAKIAEFGGLTVQEVRGIINRLKEKMLVMKRPKNRGRWVHAVRYFEHKVNI